MWWRCEGGFPRHPKVSAVLWSGSPAAHRALLWWWFACCQSVDQLTDGVISAAEAAQIHAANGPATEGASLDDVVALLIECGMLDRCNGGFRIHDFLDYQPSAAQVRRDRTARSKAAKVAGKASAQARQRKRNDDVGASLAGRSRIDERQTNPETETETDLIPSPSETGAAVAAPARRPRAPRPVAAPERERTPLGDLLGVYREEMAKVRGDPRASVTDADAAAAKRLLAVRTAEEAADAVRRFVGDDWWGGRGGWPLRSLTAARATGYLAPAVGPTRPARDRVNDPWIGRKSGEVEI